MCVEHEKFQNGRTCVEVRHEVLVKESKEELFRLMLVLQEEEHFEVDDVKQKINDEHELSVKEEYFD